jgi:DNA-binding transcriptional MocR family regulator
MNQVEAVVYLLLCVVADRNGISCYRPETLARLVKQSTDRVERALEGLASRDFIAREGRFVQVANLEDRDPPRENSPKSPGRVPADAEDEDQPPERVAATILDALPAPLREVLLEKARARLRPMLGNRPATLSVLQAMAVSLWKEESSP